MSEIETVYGIELDAIGKLRNAIRNSDPMAGARLSWADIERWVAGPQPTFSDGYAAGWNACVAATMRIMADFKKDRP